jgi:MSHA biogenesis protein MshK
MKAIQTVAMSVMLLLAATVTSAEGLRDPTRPAKLGPGPTLIAPGVEAVRLEAIMDSGDSRRAIVNGKVVRAGDRVAGVQIVAIRETSIHYVRAGRDHIALLPTRKISVRAPAALHAGEP